MVMVRNRRAGVEVARALWARVLIFAVGKSRDLDSVLSNAFYFPLPFFL